MVEKQQDGELNNAPAVRPPASILVVDDSRENVRLLAGVLTHHGYTVRAATNGRLALASVEAERPDLIVLDIMMPEMDGYEVCTRLKADPDARTRDIPVIFCSVEGDVPSKVKAFSIGGIDYITKPFQIDEVLARVETHLSLRRLHKQLAAQNVQLRQEIGERRRAEQALWKSEQRLRIIAELTSDYAYSVRVGPDGTLSTEWVTDAFTRIVGYTLEQVSGSVGWRRIIHPDDLPIVLRHLDALLNGHSDMAEYRIVTKDGEVRWVQDRARAIWDDEQGRVIRFVSALQDITERWQADEAMRQFSAELQARNIELDAFAHTVAHDLKGIVAPSLGLVDFLRINHASLPDDQVASIVWRIFRNVRKMADVVDGLLLQAQVRKQEVQKSPLDMVSIVAEALQRVAHLVEEFQAEIAVPETWPEALGYAPWVEAVWVNYLSNAIKYGGRPPIVALGADLQQPGDVVRFWVRDNGQGLEKEDRDKLFVPFERLARIGKGGHGLGLSIVRGIVEKLGGEVGVESEVGEGSVFHFSLPAVTRSRD